ncbi:murein L,D-transpeptidase [Salipiger pallidus]|uniref:Murein L,D-transpeptidase n=1 Tax=Salipiger pallidus TaxID=1775170 RepID=A0A8J3EF18_9RHOB|nr:murein L,D-transpeptidase [Salipiger pallidus]
MLSGVVAIVVSGLVAGALPQEAAAQSSAPSLTAGLGMTAYKQAVAEALSEDEGLAAFYRARDFAPLWTAADAVGAERRSALIEALATASDHGLPEARYDADGLMARMARVTGERAMGEMEIELSRTFLRFAHDLNGGMLDGRRVDSGIKRPPIRVPSEALLQAMADGEPRTVIHGIAPRTPEYAGLMRAKLELERTIAHGGWGMPVTATRLELGDSGQQVVSLRDRLSAMGYLKPTLTAVFDDTMRSAVSDFQADHGLAVDGIVGGSTLSAINTSPEARLQSVLVAMERERWLNLPEGRGKRHVFVNLVDFHAKIIDDGKVTFETRSVIGHQDPDRRTPEFSDVMSHMVINPSWYVPRSIVVKEYLPQLRRNPGAVSHLEITDRNGRRVNRGRGFSQYSAASFPFSMRQPPGPRNALGLVKFMFPNKYNIYLHDTPSKSLFNQTQRTYSHGCIRLNDPQDFAKALLALQTDDPVGFFQSRLRTGAETRVNLETPVPVHLVYRTAFTTPKGHINFRNDVYGRDAKIWQALAAEGVALGRPQS